MLDGQAALVHQVGAHERDDERVAAAERRKALVKDLIARHIDQENWWDILRCAHAAAEAGQKELLLRFPGGIPGDIGLTLVWGE